MNALEKYAAKHVLITALTKIAKLYSTSSKYLQGDGREGFRAAAASPTGYAHGTRTRRVFGKPGERVGGYTSGPEGTGKKLPPKHNPHLRIAKNLAEKPIATLKEGVSAIPKLMKNY